MRARNDTARWFSIPPSPDTRKSSPILRTPARSSSLRIRRSATMAPTAYDNEAGQAYIEGLVVREFSPVASNWRSEQTPTSFLAENGIPIISDIDTRALVRHLRTRGVMRGVLSSMPAAIRSELVETRPRDSFDGRPRSGDARVHGETLQVDEGVEPCSPSERVAAAAEPLLPRGRLRLRHQAQHSAEAGAVGCTRDRGSGADARRGRDGAEARRHLPLERPRRSGASRVQQAQGPEAHRARRRFSVFASASRFSGGRWAARLTS